MSKPTSVEMAERHAKEIQTIIAEHREKQTHLDGADLVAAKRACSTAIAEACGRHVAEANELSRNVAAGNDMPLAKFDRGRGEIKPGDEPKIMEEFARGRAAKKDS